MSIFEISSLLGLCNNYGYVIMLSAAEDILSQQHGKNKTTTVDACLVRLLNPLEDSDEMQLFTAFHHSPRVQAADSRSASLGQPALAHRQTHLPVLHGQIPLWVCTSETCTYTLCFVSLTVSEWQLFAYCRPPRTLLSPSPSRFPCRWPEWCL